MKPKICFSVTSPRKFSIEDFPFDGYELKPTKKGFFNIINVINWKEKYSKKNLSLHSQLSRVLSCNDRNLGSFMEAELLFLKSEIIASKMMGIKEINFHMKEGEFSQKEIDKFNEVISFAKKNGIELIYENHVCSDEIILRILETFPSIGFCLDIGHVNCAIHNGKFKMDLNQFIEKTSDRLVHIHAHNNYGNKDIHNSLDDGNFNWRSLLDKLENKNLRKIILETREEDTLDSKKLLEEYYNSK